MATVKMRIKGAKRKSGRKYRDRYYQIIMPRYRPDGSVIHSK